MNKALVLYLTVLLVFVAGVYVALDQGRKLSGPQFAGVNKPAPNSAVAPSPSLLDNLKQNLQETGTGWRAGWREIFRCPTKRVPPIISALCRVAGSIHFI